MSLRGWANGLVLLYLVLALIGIFALYPIVSWYYNDGSAKGAQTSGYNLGGVNATGQVPMIPGFYLPLLILIPQKKSEREADMMESSGIWFFPTILTKTAILTKTEGRFMKEMIPFELEWIFTTGRQSKPPISFHTFIFLYPARP